LRRNPKSENGCCWPSVLWVALVGIAPSCGVITPLRESTRRRRGLTDIWVRVSGAQFPARAIRVLADDNQMVAGGARLLAETRSQKDYEGGPCSARRAPDLAEAQAQRRPRRAVNVPLTSTTSSSQLTSANAGLASSRGPKKKTIGAAQSQKCRKQQANYTKASADLKRMEELVQKDEISRPAIWTHRWPPPPPQPKATLDAGDFPAEGRPAEGHGRGRRAPVASGANVVARTD